MTESTGKAAVKLCLSGTGKAGGITYYGGEPLLQKQLIFDLTEYGTAEAIKAGKKFAFKMTTNGILLDNEFIEFVKNFDFEIAVSYDGVLQDKFRCFPDGEGTKSILDAKLPMILSAFPDTPALCTVPKNGASEFGEAVIEAFNKGFKRVNCVIDYRPDAGWEDIDLIFVKKGYEKIRDYLMRFPNTDGGNRRIFMPFEDKIFSLIKSDNCADRCRLGKKQPSVAPDGIIYPCVQFVGKPEYKIGDVYKGIDAEAAERLYKKSLEPVISCVGCSIADRCRHHCACLNYQLTGDMNTVSPLQCEHERILIQTADLYGEHLYKSGILK